MARGLVAEMADQREGDLLWLDLSSSLGSGNRKLSEKLLLRLRGHLISLIQAGDLDELQRVAKVSLRDIDERSRGQVPEETHDALVSAQSMVDFVYSLCARIDSDSNVRLVQANVNHSREILNALDSSPVLTHKQLSEKLGLGDSNLSNHMPNLVERGLVLKVREGSNTFYYGTAQGAMILQRLGKSTADISSEARTDSDASSTRAVAMLA
jgi:DNA-binding transcriptional ArsR family regulator